MNPRISLIGEEDYTITLPLSETHTTYSGEETLEIVYQDMEYSYRIDGLDDSFVGSKVKIRINNKEVPINDPEFIRDGESLSVEFIPKEKKPPFFLIYGITDIVVQFTLLPDWNKRFLFSGYLAVAINQDYTDNLDSIGEMLDDIYKKDHHLLYSEKPRSKQVQPRHLRYDKNKYEEELSLLKQSVQTLHRLLPYFLYSPRRKLHTEYKLDSFEKLQRVNSKNLIYIATHPEHLKPSYGVSGIPVGKQRVFPEKTLVTSNTFSCDTEESRAVLSFIHTLFLQGKRRVEDITKTLNDSQYNISVNGVVKDNYVLSASIIQQYTKLAFIEYLDDYEDIVESLSDLFSQYHKAIPCIYSHLTHIPSPSPAFLDMYHYRKVFELMVLWFGKSEIHFPTKNPLFHFASADAIYEYYCLLHLCDVLVELGFKEQKERRMRYQYSVDDVRFKNTEWDNTYYFQKDDCWVTLYFQPVVYSYESETTNEIELFRADKPNKYYTPDFIIKKEDSSGTKYGILDSKWRTRKSLLDEGGLSETVYKYIYSILDIHSLKPVPFFWLMQGKDAGVGVRTPQYFHRSGRISKLMEKKKSPEEYREFRYATGIVPVTPKYGTDGLLEILQVFLS